MGNAFRIWSWVATALISAALGDAVTERAENAGWLGGSVRDLQHQAVLPTLVAGLVSALALIVVVMFVRTAVESATRQTLGERWMALLYALCAAIVVSVLMEGYETRFGGVSPFDARSVVVSHAPALLIACIAVAAALQLALGAAIRLAWRAGDAVAGVLGAFFCRAVRANASLAAAYDSAFIAWVLRVPIGRGGRGWGLRAPPRRRALCCLH